MDDLGKTGGMLKRGSNQDSIKRLLIPLEKSFESRIRELSGNHRFQLTNLSPDIQVIIKRYLCTKAKDNWDQLGSCMESSPQPGGVTEQYSPFKRTIYPDHQLQGMRVDSLYSGLFETLQVRRIGQQRKGSGKDERVTEPNGGRPLQFQPAMKKVSNLPQIMDNRLQNSTKGFIVVNKCDSHDYSMDSSLQAKAQELSNTVQIKKSVHPNQYPIDVDSSKHNTRYWQQSFKEDSPMRQFEDTLEKLPRKIQISTKLPLQSSISKKYPIKKKTIPQQADELLPIFKDPKFQRDRTFQIKYAAYREVHNVLNLGNNLFVQTPQPLTFTAYRCYVCKGNNGMMRWWWSCIENKDDLDQINFMWTQSKSTPFIDVLKQLRRNRDESLSTAMNLQMSGDESQNSSESEGRVSIRKKSYKPGNPTLQRTTQEQNIDESLKAQPDYARWRKIISGIEVELLGNLINGKRILSLEQASKHKRQITVYNEPGQLKYHNHLEHHYHLTNKKALFYNMRAYYQNLKVNVFNYLPLTFHLKGPNDTEEWSKLSEAFQRRSEEELQSDRKVRNIWIVKPGENSNRGNGIRVCSTMLEVKEIVNSGGTHKNGMPKTYIVQQYIDRPLLYQKRKFDIRCFTVISSINGCIRGYWYQEGYVRTSSKEFSVKNLQNRMIHLTNDAVQKKSDNYGRYEKGNKVSFDEFQKYVQAAYQADFMGVMYGQMKTLARDAVRAAFIKIDPNRRENSFEVLGLDFMIDEQFKVWLIEVNTNPCLETTSPILNRIIPQMIDNVFRIILDPLFPPPHYYSPKKMVQENIIENNRFELIFDEAEDGPTLLKLFDQNDDPLIGEILEESEEEIENDDD